MARIATDARPGEAHVAENGAGDGAAAADAGEPAAAGAEAEHAAAAASATRRPRRYSPVVMRIAAEHGVDLEQVEGTGRGGRVRKQDVLAFVESGGAGGDEPPMHIE